MKHITRRRSVLNAIGDPCHYCTRVMIAAPKDIHNTDLHERGLICTEEHLRPRTMGGGNEESNITFACNRCNSLRGHTDYTIFFMFAKQVIVHYPDVPDMYLRMALRNFINALAEIAIHNRKESKKAVGQSLSKLVEELRKARMHP